MSRRYDADVMKRLVVTLIALMMSGAASAQKDASRVDAIRTVPEKTDQKRHRHNRGRRGGRPPAFDRQIYRRRNVVERCFNRLKGFRGIATRYDKTATSYEAAVNLASFLLWARSV